MEDALGAVQSILVLGATSEIAQATLRRLVSTRTRAVVLGARDPVACADFADELRRRGATTVETVAFDALDTASHPGLVDEVAGRVGDLDLVVLAFGVLGDQETAEHDAAAALAVGRVNFLGGVSVGVPLAQRLRAQGHGTIVVLSSVAGERARRSNFVYGAAKAGLDTFYQGLGDSLVGTGARVMIVRPGFVRSRMTEGLEPAPLAVAPEDVADAVVQGLARRAEIVWVPPVLRYVMSGLRHLPRALFRKLPI